MKLGKVSLLAGVAGLAAAMTPVAAFAADGDPTALDQMKTAALAFVAALGVAAVAVAIAVLGVRLIPVAYRNIVAYLGR